MDSTPNDPEYLQALVQGLQQQRNQANDTIAHLAAQHVQKDARIVALEAQIQTLKASPAQSL